MEGRQEGTENSIFSGVLGATLLHVLKICNLGKDKFAESISFAQISISQTSAG